jgi:hypothetical protein
MMIHQTGYSFGYALAAQRQVELEAAARRNSVARALRRAGREARRRDGSDGARAGIPRQRGAAKCAADIG